MTCVKIMQHLLTSSSELQLLMVVLMAAPLSASSSSPPLREKSFGRLPLNDVVFTDDVLQEASARSRIECSEKCVETEGCVMCTFHSSPEDRPQLPGLCRLHSQVQGTSDPKQSRPGAKSVGTAGRPLGCEDGYTESCERCLKAVASSLKYTDARQRCRDEGGQLIMPKSSQDANCMWTFRRNQGLGRTWMGADDSQQPRVFRWNDGSVLSDTSGLWGANQPDKTSPGNNCVYFYPTDPGLSDYDCRSTYHYMCQKDLA